ncbi:MAG: NAD(P)H-dependent oxidoreductase [Elainellaceae cyanobacterium]
MMQLQLSYLTPKILRIDSSARHRESVSRALADNLVAKLQTRYPQAQVTTRDVNHSLPMDALVDEFQPIASAA